LNSRSALNTNCIKALPIHTVPLDLECRLLGNGMQGNLGLF